MKKVMKKVMKNCNYFSKLGYKTRNLSKLMFNFIKQNKYLEKENKELKDELEYDGRLVFENKSEKIESINTG